jgi:hypothetical protein
MEQWLLTLCVVQASPMQFAWWSWVSSGGCCSSTRVCATCLAMPCCHASACIRPLQHSVVAVRRVEQGTALQAGSPSSWLAAPAAGACRLVQLMLKHAQCAPASPAGHVTHGGLALGAACCCQSRQCAVPGVQLCLQLQLAVDACLVYRRYAAYALHTNAEQLQRCLVV